MIDISTTRRGYTFIFPDGSRKFARTDGQKVYYWPVHSPITYGWHEDEGPEAGVKVKTIDFRLVTFVYGEAKKSFYIPINAQDFQVLEMIVSAEI